jgi:hypothetical protein
VRGAGGGERGEKHCSRLRVVLSKCADNHVDCSLLSLLSKVAIRALMTHEFALA